MNKIISNNKIKFTFSENNGSLISVENLANGKIFSILPELKLPFWQVELCSVDNDKTVILADTDFSPKIIHNDECKDESIISLLWQIPITGKSRNFIKVKVIGRLPKDSNLSYWRIRIENHTQNWNVRNIIFPIINLETDKNTELVLADNWGRLIKNPVEKFQKYSLSYPGHYMMQFCAINSNKTGLYIAAHDPAAKIKTFEFETNKKNQILCSRIVNYPQDMNNCNPYFPPQADSSLAKISPLLRGRNEGVVELGYDIVIGIFQGDWYDAAQIYRQWATEQKWCSKGPIVKRKDYPEILKKVGIWTNAGLDSQKRTSAGMVIKKAKYLQKIPIACHYYYWHQIPFDHSYPQYFPAKPEFYNEVKKLKKHKIPFMPYINARLWDSESDHFTEALPWCAKDEKQEKYIEVYGSKRKLCVMCPSTKFWQDKIYKIVSKLIKEFNIDGIYLDQIGIAPPKLCFDSSHKHRLGGRDEWVSGYREMLSRIRRQGKKNNSEFFITTEGNDEPYLDLIDGQLMVNACGTDMIPLFTAVYSGYTIMFGVFYIDDKEFENGGESLAAKMAETFMFGGQIGWDLPDKIFTEKEYSRLAEYIKKLARTRYLAYKYMSLGKFLKPLKFKNKIPNIKFWRRTWSGVISSKLPAVLSSVWQAVDGTVAVLLTNFGKENQEVGYSLDFAQYGITKQNFLLYKVNIKTGKEKLVTKYNQPIIIRDDIIKSRDISFFKFKFI